jgi:hypothetical protein
MRVLKSMVVYCVKESDVLLLVMKMISHGQGWIVRNGRAHLLWTVVLVENLRTTSAFKFRVCEKMMDRTEEKFSIYTAVDAPHDSGCWGVRQQAFGQAPGLPALQEPKLGDDTVLPM